ncbi:MAG: indole-3-glycerol-phosphate synthase TrpC, partial [Candidatus Hydrogenedentes bacterium]|nr:indole-3-glycerol-phosphate synthase TrpC [Candidatus Hydrogenedentota bacterium]
MILDEICAYQRDEVDRCKLARPLAEVQEAIERAPAPRDFRGALRQDGISLIAEVKKASPVRGTFLEGVEPVDLGALYEQSGARAISVLTNERFFKGSLDDLVS